MLSVKPHGANLLAIVHTRCGVRPVKAVLLVNRQGKCAMPAGHVVESVYCLFAINHSFT